MRVEKAIVSGHFMTTSRGGKAYCNVAHNESFNLVRKHSGKEQFLFSIEEVRVWVNLGCTVSHAYSCLCCVYIMMIYADVSHEWWCKYSAYTYQHVTISLSRALCLSIYPAFYLDFYITFMWIYTTYLYTHIHARVHPSFHLPTSHTHSHKHTQYINRMYTRTMHASHVYIHTQRRMLGFLNEYTGRYSYKSAWH